MRRVWRSRSSAAIVLAGISLIATACTSEQASAPQTTDASGADGEADNVLPTTEPSSTAMPPLATTPAATTVPATPAPTTVPRVAGAFTAIVPDHVRAGSFGLVTVIGGIETVVVDTPVTNALSDGAGGYVYRTDDQFWWRAAGSDAPIAGDFWGSAASTSDGRPVIVKAEFDESDGCAEENRDGVYEQWLVTLDSGSSELIGCARAIGDYGRSITEHRSGRQVYQEGTAYANIAYSTGLSIADVDGASLAEPAIMATPDWCDVCDVSARLSRDGSEVAMWYRSDYAWVGGDDGSEWFNPIRDPVAWNERLDTDPADLRITDLDDGAVRYRTPAPARTGLHEFDGRFIVLVPRLDSTEPTLLIDTTGEQPPIGLDDFGFLLRPETSQGYEIDVEPVALARGDIGPWVTYLQQQLVVGGVDIDIDIDGRFGPDTEAAVVAAQGAAGLPPTGEVGIATWSALT